MRRLRVALVGILLVCGCLVSLDEGLWQTEGDVDFVPVVGLDAEAPVEGGQTDADLVRPDLVQADLIGDGDGSSSDGLVTPPDGQSDLTPPDVAPPPDVTPDQGCVDSCPAGATQCADTTSVQSCELALSGCLAWAAPAPCQPNEVCSDGQCTCTDECSANQTQCVTQSSMRSCELSPSGCLAWGTPVPCKTNEECTNGQCVPTCTDECTAGQTRCADDSTMQSCELKASGCLDWVDSLVCAWNERCIGELCLLVCSTSPGIASLCDPLTNSGCIVGDCYLTANGTGCVCPPGTVPNGEVCNTGSECEPTHVCFDTPPPGAPGECRPMCDPLQPDCGNGTCFTIIDFEDYGYCEP
jgi:hypothetical protein